MSYTIAISAQQQAIIAAALAAYALPGQPQYTGEEQDEAMVLRDLFTNLPQEAQGCTPNTVHGFAL